MEVNGKDDITESQMSEYDCIHLYGVYECVTHVWWHLKYSCELANTEIEAGKDGGRFVFAGAGLCNCFCLLPLGCVRWHIWNITRMMIRLSLIQNY